MNKEMSARGAPAIYLIEFLACWKVRYPDNNSGYNATSRYLHFYSTGRPREEPCLDAVTVQKASPDKVQFGIPRPFFVSLCGMIFASS